MKKIMAMLLISLCGGVSANTTEIIDMESILSTRAEIKEITKETFKHTKSEIKNLYSGYVSSSLGLGVKTLNDSCTFNLKAADQKFNFSLSDNSEIKILVDLQNNKAILDLIVAGNAHASTELRARTGYKVNYIVGSKCFHSPWVEKDISAKSKLELKARFEVALNANHEIVGNDLKINFNPKVVSSSHSFDARDFRISAVKILGVDVTRAVLGVFNDIIIHKAIEEKIIEKTVNAELKDARKKAEEKIEEFDKVIIVEFNNSDISSFVASHLENMNYKHEFLLTPEYIRENQDSLLFNVIMGNERKVRSILTSRAACSASKPLMVSMNKTQPGTSDFSYQSWNEYCKELYSDTYQIGDVSEWENSRKTTRSKWPFHKKYSKHLNELPWTLSNTTRLDLGAQSIRGNWQPYMKRVKYRTIKTYTKSKYCRFGKCWTSKKPRGTGECKLEMRIYKKNINQKNLKPLIALHGGSWKYRGAAFLGMESQISHYTDKGFVVFAPFYRLTGSSDGNRECNGAMGAEIIDDVEAAMEWVSNNKSKYGAAGKLNLVGYSAGAHLAAYLSVHHGEKFNKSLLMYPPLDFRNYIADAQESGDLSGQGVDAIEGFLGNSLLKVNLDSDFVDKNSFPELVLMNRSTYPGFYIVHGVSDSLVPSNQSVRMCNALHGHSLYSPTTNDGGDSNSGQYSKTYNCGNHSKLTLVAEGEHALDVCIPGVLCPSGSEASRQEISRVMDGAQNWLAN